MDIRTIMVKKHNLKVGDLVINLENESAGKIIWIDDRRAHGPFKVQDLSSMQTYWEAGWNLKKKD